MVGELGKEGLAGLAYCTRESKMEVSHLLYGIAMDKLGKKASVKQENSEIIRDSLRKILNKHDDTGVLSSRFGV